MEALVSAVLGDLISRSISFAMDRCSSHWRREATVEDNLQRLSRVLMRIRITVEEAERRRVTNRAVLRQLQLMREGLYRGYYVLSDFKRRVFIQDKAQDRRVSFHDHSFTLSRFNPAKRVCNLWLENCMFGREAEKERIIDFLLEPAPAGTEDLGVLPVIGQTRVGKSTLVEHVCYDERVRNHFSMIVFFGESNILDENLYLIPLGDNCSVIKHRNNLASTRRSLVVIELVGNMDESTWRRTLSTLMEERTAPLPREAYWYFFKTIAFGSAGAEEQPEVLASVCMEIADILNRSFIGATITASILRGNLCPQFWHKVLKRMKDHMSMHLVLFREHPSVRLANDQPIYIWRLPKSDSVLIAYSCYQQCSAQQHDLPKITWKGVQVGSATPQGKFEALAWTSRIPPYYSYVMNCGVQKPSSLRIPHRNKQIRQQQARLNSI